MFKILKNQTILDFKEFVFPAGEVSVKLNAAHYKYKSEDAATQTIIARIHNSEDLFKLAMVKDALQRIDNTPINLFLPYVPYARQDRVCDKGEALSIAVFARFIKSLNFNRVIIADPHSDVTPVAFEVLEIPLTVLSQFDIINKHIEFARLAMGCTLVSPDAGANKKTAYIAGYLGHRDFIRADKLRDLSNGKILETTVYCGDLKGQDVIIVDDLCERGGTFLLLAKALKAKNCGKIYLWVTHGVFGGEKERNATLQNLLDNGIDKIYTTNSYFDDLILTNPKLDVFNLETAFGHIL